MDQLHADHLNRTKSSVLKAHSLATTAKWICENTSLRGEPFSFKDHEFQEMIVSDPSRQKNIRKCAQIGLSELSARVTLALANILDSSTFIYTLPTADFAASFVKTRVDPIILTSSHLRSVLNNTADNTKIKQFGTSFVYFKGTIGQSAAISVPADGLIHDEVDFSDQTVMSSYESRIIHSAYKFKYKFSTPTVAGYGISAEFDTSRRFWNMAKCNHCAHWFLPNYDQDVRIPGFGGDKKEITKDSLHRLRWQEAALLCPSCGAEPDLTPANRAWVCENPSDNFEAVGYQIQPFDAPRIITPSYLVEASTKYDRFVDFCNFGLGLPAEDKESSLTREELEACFIRGEAPGFFTAVMGIDMGMRCHVKVGAVDPHGRLMVVHTEVVPLAKLQERKNELARQYRVSLTVMDSQPYTETLFRLQERDQNLYGAVYVTSKDLAMYYIKKVEEKDRADKDEKKADEGEQRERQVNINRNKALDGLMHFVRGGNLLILEDENKETIIKHLQDMKRIKEFTAEKEVTYVWQKSAKGQDHFHHALLYLWIASKMRGVATSSIILPGMVFGVKTKIAV